MTKQHTITQAEFDTLLEECLAEETPGGLLQIPGLYEIVAEYFNNDILDRYEEDKGTRG